MRIIPAIDIIDGKCVRLSQGDYTQKTVYSEEPLEIAKSFEDHGIKHLHLVDLDGAKSSKIVNLKVLENICATTNLSVDFGGGIKSAEAVSQAFDAGAKQVTLGSIAVKNSKITQELLLEFEDKIILGADVKGNKIAVSGWTEITDLSLFDFIKSYQDFGLKSIISTDITTDGMLQGPSVELYRHLVSAFPNLNVIASGGVSSTNDLDKLKSVNVEGVIIGKAIYEGKISLKQLEAYVD